MKGTRRARWFAAVPAALVAQAVLAGPAWASCAPPPPMEQAIADAKQVFVGTVEALADEGYRATVRVEEVWKGPDVAPVTEVNGSPHERSTEPDAVQVRSSVDRRYTQGTKYLFVLYDDSAPYEDNICNSTSEWQDDYARYRPADARPPGSAPSDGGSGDPGVTTTGGDPDSEEPTMVGTGPDTPVSSDDTVGTGSPSTGVPEGAEPGAEETATEPASARTGLDSRLLLAMAAGFAALVWAAWWLRRDA